MAPSPFYPKLTPARSKARPFYATVSRLFLRPPTFAEFRVRRFTVVVRTKLHYVTIAMLLIGAVSRVVAWRPAPTIPADDRFMICLVTYSVLLASYAILAAVAWYTRRLHHFPIVLCIGTAANVAFGIYRDYHHFIYSDRSWYGGLDVLDAMGQIIVVLGGLLLVAFLYGLSSMLNQRA